MPWGAFVPAAEYGFGGFPHEVIPVNAPFMPMTRAWRTSSAFLEAS
jgi:hypothetical protein